MLQVAKITKTLGPLKEILEKDTEFLRIPREAFVDFEGVELQNLSFGKTTIESWNYETLLDSILKEKLSRGLRYPDEIAAQEIFKDIKKILSQCFDLSEDYYPHEVSLSVVQGVPCTKLHADFLPLRLVCTYLGPGTIFLPKESTRYPCLNEGRPNKRVLIKDKPVYQANPFEILILKGRKFNKGEIRPCAHRSPEVVNGEKRLVLKVDFN